MLGIHSIGTWGGTTAHAGWPRLFAVSRWMTGIAAYGTLDGKAASRSSTAGWSATAAGSSIVSSILTKSLGTFKGSMALFGTNGTMDIAIALVILERTI